jgi:hypothetical protein
MDMVVNAYGQDFIARLEIVAAGFTCEGHVHLPVKMPGRKMRMSDLINEPNEFLVVTNATVVSRVHGTNEQRSAHYETIFLRKGEIKYVVPLEA